MSQHDRNARAWHDRTHWHGGPLGLYAAKDDTRAFVPTRSGLGVTVNLSTRTGLGFMLGMLVFVAVLVWVSTTTPRRPAHRGPPPAPAARS